MGGKTILIADDDQDFLRMEAQFLTHAGYSVLFARDAYQAVHSALTSRPDLLILDIHMPAGEGLSVQERIQLTPSLRDTPVIYMTGETSEAVDTAAREMGAFAVLRKPFDIAMLMETIEGALRRPDSCVLKNNQVLRMKAG